MKVQLLKKLAVGICLISFTISFSQAKPKVVLDNFFNNEEKKDKNTGEIYPWHYIWEDSTYGGFSILGELFTKHGAAISSLKNAPTKKDLKSTDVYIIVDPDIDKEAIGGKANLIDPKTIKNLEKWVKKGGVLVLLSNDTNNSEFEHFNQLANQFGIHFNGDSYNRVQGKEFAQGAVYVSEGNEIFSPQKLYMKEVSSLSLSGNAKPILEAEGKTIGAISKHGKGTVFALGDPWCYNEYTDGKKLPADFTNFQGAEEFAKWILEQTDK